MTPGASSSGRVTWPCTDSFLNITQDSLYYEESYFTTHSPATPTGMPGLTLAVLMRSFQC